MPAPDDQDGPEDRARVHWSVPPPPPGAPGPEAPSDAALSDEFLYHLYRGSELLQEDQVYEAKSELEQALSFKPKDAEGQGLLGQTYFRLGHYPRAIRIYEELVRARPAEVAPRVNLGLCYLKTGQLPLARSLLEELVSHHPEHTRAWGYLGLIYQRVGDLEKAAVAFDRAGRPQLAARLRGGVVPEGHAEAAQEASSGVQEITQDHVRAAPSIPPPPDVAPDTRASVPAPSRRPSPSGAWTLPGTRVSIPAPLDRVAREALLMFPERPRVAAHDSGVALVRIERSFNARSDGLRALLPESPGALTSSVLKRRGRPGASDDPLGGPSTPFVTLEGKGRLVLGAPERFTPWVSTLDGEPFYAREERILGFDGALEPSSGRLALADDQSAALLQLTGTGFVVIAVRGAVHGLDVNASRPIEVRLGHLVGWIGRLVPRLVPRGEAPAGLADLVTLSGTGVVLIDGG